MIEATAPVRRVAIIGAGAGGSFSGLTPSGATLALLASRAGFLTVLEDVLPANLRRAAALIAEGEPAPHLRYAGSIEDAVRDADIVIDTVPDELESKLEILSLLDRMAPPATLFATPTQHLSIADLASCTYRPGQCFALRFSSLRPLGIELSYPPGCAPAILARMRGFLQALDAQVCAFEDTRALP